MRWKLFILFSAGVFLYSSAWATPLAEIVQPSQLLSTKIKYKVGTRTKSKLIYCLGKVPGTAANTASGLLFTPVATTIAKMKLKKIKGPKLNAQLAIKKAGGTACARLLRANPTPTPTPTPILVGSGNFDISGNVTEKGKIEFGIPGSLSGNISIGKTIATTYCIGCHLERNGRSFPTLQGAIYQPPMSFDSTQISDQMLANLAAYLNRFSP